VIHISPATSWPEIILAASRATSKTQQKIAMKVNIEKKRKKL
jgi:hypothetical protein